MGRYQLDHTTLKRFDWQASLSGAYRTPSTSGTRCPKDPARTDQWRSPRCFHSHVSGRSLILRSPQNRSQSSTAAVQNLAQPAVRRLLCSLDRAGGSRIHSGAGAGLAAVEVSGFETWVPSRPDSTYQAGSLISTLRHSFRTRLLMLRAMMVMVFLEHTGRSLRCQRCEQAT